MRHPSSTAPTTFSRGTATSVKKVSAKCVLPVIWRRGRMSMPGVSMSMMSTVMPLCLGTSGLVRT